MGADKVRWAQAQNVEEAKARRERLAKMRSLLFHQEIKLKHLAKIKSKDYHRRALRAAKVKVRLLALPALRLSPFPSFFRLDILLVDL